MKNVRLEVKIKKKDGITDAFNDFIKVAFDMTDDEYDFLCENASDEEFYQFLGGLGTFESPPTFCEKRKSLDVRNKYLSGYGRKSEEI
jgi:hypothetical protein